MNKNRDIFIVAGTVVALTMAIPVLDSLTLLITSAINAKINRMQLALNLDVKENEAAAEVISPSPSITNAIGFEMPPEPDYSEEWDNG